MVYRLKVDALVTAFGGVQALRRALLHAEGFDAVPETAAVHKWVARGTVPGPWILLLSVYAAKHAPHLDPGLFVERIETPVAA